MYRIQAMEADYEAAKEGFVLRCRVKAVKEHEVRQYEFKVQRKMARKQWEIAIFPSHLHLHGVECKLVWRLVEHRQEKVLPLVI